MNRRGAAVTGLVVAAVLMLGCGSSAGDGTQAGSDGGGVGDRDGPTSTQSTWQLFDCSGFRRFSREYVNDLTTVATHVAGEDPPEKLSFACVDGRPLTDAQVRTVDFAAVGGGADVDPEVLARLRMARASGLGAEYRRWIAHGRTVSGSGLLQALVFPAQQSHVKKVYFWTDGEVRDRDSGFNLPTASRSRIDREVARWKGRLAGLRGVELIVLGGGRGAQDQATALKAQRLFAQLMRAVGGTLVWAPTLGQVND